MKKYLKKLFFYKQLVHLHGFLDQKLKPIKGKNNNIHIQGKTTKITFDIIGNNNEVIIHKNSYVSNCLIYLRGNDHKIIIDEGVVIYKGELWAEDENCEIFIATGTSIESAHIAVTEKGRKIHIGANCMLSTNIEIRTGDSHSIVEMTSGVRINPGADVILEDHVWIGSKVSILKGVSIGNGTIIGTGSIVTKSVPPFSLAAGVPCKVLKTGVTWKKEKI